MKLKDLKENFKGMWIMALAFVVIFGVFTFISSMEKAEEQRWIALQIQEYNFQCGLRAIHADKSLTKEEFRYFLGQDKYYIAGFCANPK